MPAEAGFTGKDALVAILRGVDSERVGDVAGVIYAAGIRIIEVPLNSPQPFKSIAALSSSLPADCLVGAGTVLISTTCAALSRPAPVDRIPNFDAEVIGRARANMVVLLGGDGH